MNLSGGLRDDLDQLMWLRDFGHAGITSGRSKYGKEYKTLYEKIRISLKVLNAIDDWWVCGCEEGCNCIHTSAMSVVDKSYCWMCDHCRHPQRLVDFVKEGKTFDTT